MLRTLLPCRDGLLFKEGISWRDRSPPSWLGSLPHTHIHTKKYGYFNAVDAFAPGKLFLKTCHKAIEDGDGVVGNIREAMTILCSIKGQMCKEKKVKSPTKHELMLGLEKVLERTPKAEQAAEIASIHTHLTEYVAKELFTDSPTYAASTDLLDSPTSAASADLLTNKDHLAGAQYVLEDSLGFILPD